MSIIDSNAPIIKNYESYKMGSFSPTGEWFIDILSLSTDADWNYVFTLSERDPRGKRLLWIDKPYRPEKDEEETVQREENNMASEASIEIELSPDSTQLPLIQPIVSEIRHSYPTLKIHLSPGVRHYLMEQLVLLEELKGKKNSPLYSETMQSILICITRCTERGARKITFKPSSFLYPNLLKKKSKTNCTFALLTFFIVQKYLNARSTRIVS